LIPIVAGSYVYGAWRDKTKAREIGVLGTESLLDSLIVQAHDRTWIEFCFLVRARDSKRVRQLNPDPCQFTSGTAVPLTRPMRGHTLREQLDRLRRQLRTAASGPPFHLFKLLGFVPTTRYAASFCLKVVARCERSRECIIQTWVCGGLQRLAEELVEALDERDKMRRQKSAWCEYLCRC
jgi:hypothetical protein